MVFIGQRSFEGATSLIEVEHIRRQKPVGRQGRHKLLIHPVAHHFADRDGCSSFPGAPCEQQPDRRRAILQEHLR